MLEVIGQSIEDIKRISKSKATRIEFCESIKEDGLTPNLDFLKECLKYTTKPFRVMVRPQNKFVTDDKEVKEMINYIKELKKLNHPMIEGIVIGYITKDNEIDKEHITQLVEIAKPLKITFHKASDSFIDNLKIFEDMKIDTVLTQGGKTVIEENYEKLEKIKSTSNKVELLLGGGVSLGNISKLKNISKSIHVGSLARFNKSYYDDEIDIEMIDNLVETIGE